jgi:hypothetical protein
MFEIRTNMKITPTEAPNEAGLTSLILFDDEGYP